MRARHRKAWAGAAASTMLLGLALIAPSGAAAKHTRTFVVPGGGPQYGFRLEHGKFRLELSAEPEGGVDIAVSRGGSHGTDSSNVYFDTARGQVSSDGRMDADLGSFGAVDLAFHPRGVPLHEKFPVPGCHGRPRLDQRGVFTGRFRFRGEGGYVSVSAGRIAGKSVTSFRQTCTESGGGRTPSQEHQSEAAELTASTPDGSLSLEAIGIPIEGGPTLGVAFASSTRHFGKIIEIRSADASRRGGFEFDEGLTSATLDLGAPFEGSATFERGSSGAPTWTGDLRVDFLGGSEKLTGGGIEASLQHLKSGGSGSFAGSFFANLTRSPVPIDR